MKKFSIFHLLFIGGMLFVSLAVFVIHNDPAVRWYLIGQGQIIGTVGFVGIIFDYIRKKKE